MYRRSCSTRKIKVDGVTTRLENCSHQGFKIRTCREKIDMGEGIIKNSQNIKVNKPLRVSLVQINHFRLVCNRFFLFYPFHDTVFSDLSEVRSMLQSVSLSVPETPLTLPGIGKPWGTCSRSVNYVGNDRNTGRDRRNEEEDSRRVGHTVPERSKVTGTTTVRGRTVYGFQEVVLGVSETRDKNRCRTLYPSFTGFRSWQCK